MDKLINAGKEFLEDKVQRNDQSGNDGKQSQGINIPSAVGGFLSGGNDDDDMRKAKDEAANRAGSSGSSDMFSSIISSLGQKKDLDKEDIDEEDAIKKHKKTYVDQDDENDDSKSLGTAAAMQALKLFNQGETGNKQQGKGEFLGLAMSEASKLFDDKNSQGKVAEGTSKESVIQQAGEMALKMFLKGQAGGQGGLMGIASKFM